MRRLLAITRPVSRSIASCELTELARVPIDYARAVAQHEVYEEALYDMGCKLVVAPRADRMPDAVFVEDTAVVLEEIAIMTQPGAASRRGELDAIEAILKRYRRLEHISAPATLDGGDVLQMGRRIFVGRSSRTSDEGIEQLRALVNDHGYRVEAVDVHDCLHLKSAVTAVGDQMVLGNSAWVDRAPFDHLTWIEVDAAEPHAANALWFGGDVLYPAAYPRTAVILRAYLARQNRSLREVDASELAKAEGGVTCQSLIFSR